MNLNYDDDIIKQLITDYQHAEGIQKNRIYNRLYPFLNRCINLYIYNINNLDEIPDARQNIHIALLTRLQTIKADKIENVKDYFFIMCKRLILNEIDKINVWENRKELHINAAELLPVFIVDEAEEL